MPHPPIQLDGAPAAPPLLLVNSLSSDLSMWDDQVPTWARTRRVIRFDAAGHGRAAAPTGAVSIASLAADALAVLDRLGIAQADFVGLSMGGMIGQHLLTHAPHRLGRTVLANTAAHMGPTRLWDGRISFARAHGMDATVEPTLARWFPAPFRAANPATMDRMAAMVRRTSVEGYAACCAAIRDMDQRETIRGIAGKPVLVLIGANDPATTPADGAHIARAIPGARSLTLDAAHISNVEQPGAFTTAVEEFLSGHS